jgi:hypothetical protein
MAEPGKSCVDPAAGPINEPDEQTGAHGAPNAEKEKPKMGVQVGKPAPDFEANGYHEGGFKQFKLSTYKGQWVVLCFYPGDFTFV